MGEVKWTKEQEMAIREKGSNILVAAAAGSGKTAVLVERIINKIISEKVNIDSLLVVTFTNAAASEMRERILDAIYKKIEEMPDDENLQKQINLLQKADICTIHAFCLEVIKNNFYEIDVSPNFRIGDTTEIELLKQDILEKLFEEKYENQKENFLKLIDTYTGYRGDEPLKEMILNIYKYIQSSPFPNEWLEEKIEEFNIYDKDIDFAETKWGKILLENNKELIKETIIGLKSIKEILDQNYELDKFSQAIRQDIERLTEILDLDKWDDVYNSANCFNFTKWPVDRKIISNIKDEAKAKRDKINKKFKTEKDKLFIYSSKEAIEDIYSMYSILKPLKKLILEFGERYNKEKKERNIIDFNDIEHLALKILVKKDENGQYKPTDVAKKYKEKFSEIAIDEYQDSNLVQEYILTSISRGDNIFMVGDVKQSIYKFRQARPELFLEKYRSYLSKTEDAKKGLKIQLFKNFRSRENILDVTNLVFKEIMSKKIGDIDYNEEEYLNLGANYEEPKDNSEYAGKTELCLIDLKEENIEDEEINVLDETNENDYIENTTLEARYVANKIQTMLDSSYQVFDKKQGYRKLQCKDIVILLRATSTQAPIYERELTELGLPVTSDSSTEYLDSIEIQTIMSVLKIIDNPLQDIPLVTVMRSIIGGFTDNDLIEIRLADRYCNFYEALEKSKLNLNNELKTKIEKFLENIAKWRESVEYLSLDELIWKIYIDSGYYNYVGLMPSGKLRQANLKMLFEKAKQYEKSSFKGLFNFINFIDKVKLSSGDMSAAKIISENENVIRIMSIHKSKGLEFPVVFLCGTGKQFNLRDLNEKILLHQDIGIGPRYINYDKKIEYDTLAKEAIKIQTKKETLSEEERVLYVALTRSKEKLIITGISKDSAKELEEKELQLQLYNNNSENINSNLIAKGKSYLDWIEYVYLKNKESIEKYITLNIIKKADILKDIKKDEKTFEDLNKKMMDKLEAIKDNKEIKEIKDVLEWKYANYIATQIPSKASVTKLKELELSDESIYNIYDTNNTNYSDEKNKETILVKPKFLNEEEKLTGAEKGTVMHLLLQKLEIKKQGYKKEDLDNFIEELYEKNIITKIEKDSINKNKILNFVNSNIYKELLEAKEIQREKPFYINIPAKEILNAELEESILVQGIIDLYYINKNGELILVDYKTDYIEEGKEKELIKKYKKQLELYKRALEAALKRKVDRTYIYSVYLGKELDF